MFALIVSHHKQKKIVIRGYAQGTNYTITYYAEDSVISFDEITTLFKELDSSLSIYKKYSTISKFNDSERGGKLDKHLFRVVQKALEIYQESNGNFDITVYQLVRAWGFADNPITKLPDSTIIKKLLPCIGSDKIYLTKDSLIKRQSCIKIDVNGIAQGYSVDYIADYLESKCISNYLVEVGGEIRVKGKNENGEYMNIGIESPADFSFEEPVIRQIISLQHGAVTTSGNYRKYVESNGKRISHLVNPKTGFSFTTNMISVTVIAKDAITADAYDNVLMAMEPNEAIALAERKENMEAYLIYKNKQGQLKDDMTNGFRMLIK
ncbi:MAG: FAD:protein FMN transferase [Niabella sp.]